jgi:hypothetical protein
MRPKTKIYLDYIPLLILFCSSAYLLWTIATTNIGLVGRHYIGLAFLLVTVLLFFIRHLFGVLFLGFTNILGFFGFLSYSPAIFTTTFGKTLGEGEHLTLLSFQPIFLIWITIYFVLSGRYYVGIISKKYWSEVKNGTR